MFSLFGFQWERTFFFSWTKNLQIIHLLRHTCVKHTSLLMLVDDFVCKTHSMFEHLKFIPCAPISRQNENQMFLMNNICKLACFSSISMEPLSLWISLFIKIIPDMHSHLILSLSVAVKMLGNVHPVTIGSQSKMQYIFM